MDRKKISKQSPMYMIFRRFLQHHVAVASLIMFVFVALMCICAPLFAMYFGYNIEDVDLLSRYRGISGDHWLGTDHLGRDEFLSILFGGRNSLFIGFTAVVCATFVGTAVGLCAGFFRRIDELLMRFTDFIISLPSIPLLVLFAALDFEKVGALFGIEASAGAALSPSMRIVLLIALFAWTGTARLVRGVTLSLVNREFVKAAMALGTAQWRIILRHVLPNVVSPIVVAMTMSIGGVIIAESTISYLGFGITPPDTSWGKLLQDAQTYFATQPLLAIYPGVMIFITVICFNFLGDGLQHAIDPRSSREN